jgi:hypothetical protein
MWYPIDGGDLPTDPATDGSSNVPVAIKPADAPPSADLQDWIQSEKDLSITETLSLGFAPFSLDQSGNHRTIILDAMRYTDKDGVRWGVGARLTLHAWTETGTIKGAVALVAAQASLNLAYTRTTFQILGYNSPDLVKSLPGFEEMTVSNYADLMKAIDTCKNAVMGAPPEDLRPQPIAISLRPPTPPPPPDDSAHHWPFHIHHRQDGTPG